MRSTEPGQVRSGQVRSALPMAHMHDGESPSRQDFNSMLTVDLSLQDPSSPWPSLDIPDLGGLLSVYLYMFSPLSTSPPSLVWNTPTQLSNPTQFSLPWNSTPVPLLATEFIVCAAWNLLSTAAATLPYLFSAHLSPLPPAISLVPIYLGEHLAHPGNLSVFLEALGEQIKDCVQSCPVVHCYHYTR